MSDSNKHFLEFSRPFITGAKNVFETMVFSKIQGGRPLIKKDGKSLGDISCVMGMNGQHSKDGADNDFQGMMVLSFPTQSYIKIASAMLMEEFSEINEENRDVGAEIANIVMGNAKRELAELGYKIEMSVPSIIQGEDHIINYPKKTIVILLPFSSSHGEFFMELCYST